MIVVVDELAVAAEGVKALETRRTEAVDVKAGSSYRSSSGSYSCSYSRRSSSLSCSL